MYKNNDFIYDAATSLEKILSFPVTVETTRKEYDAVLKIKNIQFVVLSKSEVRTSNKGLVLSQLNEIKLLTNRGIIVIAKFIANDVAAELKEKNINYTDSAGNSFIKTNDFFIYISGQKAQKNKKTNQARAFQETGVKLIFSLLANPENLNLSYRELSEKKSIALGSISNIMQELEEQNFILRTKSKRVLKNKKELLNRWIVAYHDVLRPKILKKKMKFKSKEMYNNWKALLDKHNQESTKFLWSGEPAASLMTNFLKPAFYTLYTNTSWQNCMKELDMVPDENGDIEVLSFFWEIDAYNYIKSTVPPVIVYADIMNSGLDRNLETAKIILENELQDFK